MNRWHIVTALMGGISLIEAVSVLIQLVALPFGINYVGGLLEWLTFITNPFLPGLISVWAYDLAKNREKDSQFSKEK